MRRSLFATAASRHDDLGHDRAWCSARHAALVLTLGWVLFATACTESIPKPASFPEVWKQQGKGPELAAVGSMPDRLALTKDQSCVTRDDGTVQCWGGRMLEPSSNLEGYGEETAWLPGTGLGKVDAASGLGSHVAAETYIFGYGTYNWVSATIHCGIRPDQEVVCWMERNYLSEPMSWSGAPDVADQPVVIAGAGPAKQVVVTARTGCALGTDGSVRCWGDNSAGELGDGTLEEPSAPRTVIGLTDATKLATDDSGVGARVCALRATGAIVCWGDLDGTDPYTAPVELKGFPKMRDLAMGPDAICGVAADGSVWCRDEFGGPLERDSWGDLTPRPMGFPASIKVAVGEEFLCALGTAGEVRCAGINDHGELGAGTTGGARTPVEVIAYSDSQKLTGAFDVAAAGSHACAIDANGKVLCWGANDRGQTAGKQILGCSGSIWLDGGLAPVGMAMDGKLACTWSQDGKARCWGDVERQLVSLTGREQMTAYSPEPLTLPFAVADLDLINEFACAVGQDGRVRCWEDVWEMTPAAIPGVLDAVEVSVAPGTNYKPSACARTKEGAVWCWGDSSDGMLGNGNRDDVDKPHQVVLPSPAVALACGAACCAALQNGRVACWGQDDYGIIEPSVAGGDVLGPTLISEDVVSDASALDVSEFFACAVTGKSPADVVCWGNGGIIKTPATVVAPTAVAIGSSPGGPVRQHVCVIGTMLSANKKSVACWGANDRGQLGTPWWHEPYGPVSTKTPTEAQAFGVQGGARLLACGTANTCVVTDDRLACWGDTGSLCNDEDAAPLFRSAVEVELP